MSRSPGPATVHEPAARDRRTPFLAKLDHPAVPGVIALLAATAVALARLAAAAHGDIRQFILVGHRFANPARVPHGMPLRPTTGYDGQFYYRLALDPANMHHTAFGITLDTPIRLQRIGYPLLAWLASAGQHAWVPVTLVVVNVLALAAAGLLGGFLARDAGRHALWGLLFPAYFGFLASLTWDLTEPLAAACLLAGVLAYRRNRPLLAGLAFGYGVLTRETVMVAPVALALVRVYSVARRKARPGAEDLAWALPVAVFCAWQLVLRAVTGAFTLTADTHNNTGYPLSALVHALRANIRLAPHTSLAGIWLLEVAVLALFALAALAALRSTTAPGYERLAFIFLLIELCLLSATNWNGYVDLRSLDEVYLFALLLILGSRIPRAALITLTACLVPVAVIVAHQQIFYVKV